MGYVRVENYKGLFRDEKTGAIINCNDADYKARLIQLNLLPLMYWFELQDVMFVVKCIKATLTF